MKKALIWIIAAVVLVGIIAGASALYSSLSEEYKPDGIDKIEPPANQDNTSQGNNQDQGEVNGGEDNESESSDTGYSNPAPDFTVIDREGNVVKLSDMKGKPVVLNFWATWCPYCVEEMPDFEKVYNKYKGEVEFMMINMTHGAETVENASSFIDSYGYTFPVYFDTTSEAAYAYGIQSIPTTFFIDAEGYIVAYYQGSMSGDTLLRGISMIYAEIQ
jgi:peroxiredoxin